MAVALLEVIIRFVAVVRSARNYTLNPVNPNFEQVEIDESALFEIDLRLGVSG